MLSFLKCRGLTGRSCNHKAIRARANMKLDQPPQRGVINPILLIEWRNQGHNTALKHAKSSPQTRHAMLLF